MCEPDSQQSGSSDIRPFHEEEEEEEEEWLSSHGEQLYGEMYDEIME